MRGRAGRHLKRLALAAILLAPPVVGVSQPVPEPEGYRQGEYRAPVPDTLAGSRVVSAEQAAVLWQEKAAFFVDVLPRPPRPENLPDGTVWRDKPRYSIPGAAWMPNTGYGTLAPVYQTYFEDGLTLITAGDHTQALVIFCQAQCWMSWNAAKRAVELGYSNVHWFPAGTDGWAEQGLPTEELQPLAGLPQR